LDVPAWLIWAVVAIALSVGEIVTPGLFILGPVAVAAVIAGVLALAGVGAALQLIVFIAGSLASLLFLRPIAKRHLHMPAALRTGTAALEGASAVVVQRVDVHGGRVRIGGEEWSARAFMDDGVYEPGKQVEVVKIEGATALVYE
jgi:membrane protein implicated in regulation of membrane protease activity